MLCLVKVRLRVSVLVAWVSVSDDSLLSVPKPNVVLNLFLDAGAYDVCGVIVRSILGMRRKNYITKSV